jgi:hypothetical protein
MGLVSYAVLSYFKVVEIRHSDAKKAKKWIACQFPLIRERDQGHEALSRFITACGDEAPEEYIWTACRLAVAHASIKSPSDADAAEEITRLHAASYVLQQLARLMISQELGVSEYLYSGD